MSIEETKAAIVAGLQQSTINMLIDKLADVSVENERLKARVAELEKPRHDDPQKPAKQK